VNGFIWKFQVLRVLLKLLETSRDAKTLAVGCHDLGCFITHYPAGKGLVTGARPCSVLVAIPTCRVWLHN
jgi:V-ATPase subunit H